MTVGAQFVGSPEVPRALQGSSRVLWWLFAEFSTSQFSLDLQSQINVCSYPFKHTERIPHVLINTSTDSVTHYIPYHDRKVRQGSLCCELFFAAVTFNPLMVLMTRNRLYRSYQRRAGMTTPLISPFDCPCSSSVSVEKHVQTRRHRPKSSSRQCEHFNAVNPLSCSLSVDCRSSYTGPYFSAPSIFWFESIVDFCSIRKKMIPAASLHDVAESS